jgi:hypothetical protein
MLSPGRTVFKQLIDPFFLHSTSKDKKKGGKKDGFLSRWRFSDFSGDQKQLAHPQPFSPISFRRKKLDPAPMRSSMNKISMRDIIVRDIFYPTS